MVVGLYVLLGLHVYAYFAYLISPVFRRLGFWCGICWQSIGLILVYNIVFNHLLGVLVKPNGPKDLRLVENLRKSYKNREYRKSVNH
jgi:hypothetical protein